jgi:hypothetical protein
MIPLGLHIVQLMEYSIILELDRFEKMEYVYSTKIGSLVELLTLQTI